MLGMNFVSELLRSQHLKVIVIITYNKIFHRENSILDFNTTNISQLCQAKSFNYF